MPTADGRPIALEVCAGAGGQALGLERAGFEHCALVEIDKWACATLRHNRPEWNVIGPPLKGEPEIGREGDLTTFDGRPFRRTGSARVDLLSGGVPCPPFSVAGKQLGEHDERDLFPAMLDLAEVVKPRALMIENVPGLAQSGFKAYRASVLDRLTAIGYHPAGWQVLHASDFGVPQLRPRFILIAFRSKAVARRFQWPTASDAPPPTVGEALLPLMNGWPGGANWARTKATAIAPTLVGGSKKHGGPDLGPTRAKIQWDTLGVNGRLVANAPPAHDFPIDGSPCLTIEMAAVVQGFPIDAWEFIGAKTHAYRQVGNAFPPPVAEALGRSIVNALVGTRGIAPPRSASRPVSASG